MKTLTIQAEVKEGRANGLKGLIPQNILLGIVEPGRNFTPEAVARLSSKPR